MWGDNTTCIAPKKHKLDCSWIALFVPSSGLGGCRSRACTETFFGKRYGLYCSSMLTTLKQLPAVNTTRSIWTSTFVPYLGLRVSGIRNQCLEPVHVNLLDGR